MSSTKPATLAPSLLRNEIPRLPRCHPDVEHWTDRGCVQVACFSGGVFVTSMAGHLCGELSRRLMLAVGDVLTRHPTTVGFHDWAQLATYDSSARKVLMDFHLKHRHALAHSHILVRSKLVAMGVTTANMLLSLDGLRSVSYTSSASFWAEFHRQVTGASTRS